MFTNIQEKELNIILKEPVRRIDYFFVELCEVATSYAVNITKSISEYEEKDFPYDKIKKCFFELMLEQRLKCKKCSDKCYQKQHKKMDDESYQSKIVYEEFVPKVLKKPLFENYLMHKLIYAYTKAFHEYLLTYTQERLANEVITDFYLLTIAFVNDQCIKGCAYRCFRQANSSGYCSLCSNISEALPCPLKKQISFEEIGMNRLPKCER